MKKHVLYPREKLFLISFLAFIAGIVNSIGFVCFGMFVSHISGHATFSAVEFSQNSYTFSLVSISAILFFSLGAVVATLLLRGRLLQHNSRYFILPLLVEIALLGLLFILVFYHQQFTFEDSFSYVSVFLLSTAMGIQNAALRTSRTAALRTTHLTGTATDFGIALGDALVWFYKALRFYGRTNRKQKQTNIFRAQAKKRIKKPLLLFSYLPRHILRSAKRSNLFLHMFSFVFFIAGAYTGAFVYFAFNVFALLLPVFLLTCVVLFILFRPFSALFFPSLSIKKR